MILLKYNDPSEEQKVAKSSPQKFTCMIFATEVRTPPGNKYFWGFFFPQKVLVKVKLGMKNLYHTKV